MTDNKISFKQIVLIDLCWLLFSIPVVTIGISTVAAFYVMRKIIEGEGSECSIFKTFVKGFKDNWKDGILLWIITVGIGVLAYAVVIYFKNDFAPSKILIALSIVAFLLLIETILFAYPLAARYVNPFGIHLRNSLVLCLGNAKKTTILMLLLLAMCGIFVLAFFFKKILLIPAVILLPISFFYKVALDAHVIFMAADKQREENEAKQAAEKENEEADDVSTDNN